MAPSLTTHGWRCDSHDQSSAQPCPTPRGKQAAHTPKSVTPHKSPSQNDLSASLCSAGNTAIGALLDRRRMAFPWVGVVASTWSAALRSGPGRDLENPYSNIVADLRRGTEVVVVSRNECWLKVRTETEQGSTEGYVSQELIQPVRQGTFLMDPLTVTVDLPTTAEALTELKRAENLKARSGPSFQSDENATDRIDRAIIALRKTKKYAVNEDTFQVSFIAPQGEKIKVTTIEDFILFVESIERFFPNATPADIASEIRQIWFSDGHWELLSAAQGIRTAGTPVDIETQPPVSSTFDMGQIGPGTAGLTLATRHGQVDIGHVLSGIDLALSGFPKSTRPPSSRSVATRQETAQRSTRP